MERRHRPLGPYKRHELLTGEVASAAPGYYQGYAKSGFDQQNLEDFISEDMRADWLANRAELLAFWKSGEYTSLDAFPDHTPTPHLFIRGQPDTLPWAASVFDDETAHAPHQHR
jgi:hypothetical protein